MNTFTDLATGFFDWVWQTSWQAAVLVGMILLVQQLFRKRLSAGWRYGLWMLLVLRLLMPATPDSAFSVFNTARLAPRTPTLERGLGQLPALEAILPPAEPTTAAEALFPRPEQASGTSAQSPAAWSALELPREKPIASDGVEAVSPGAARSTRIDGLNVVFGFWLAGAMVFGLRLAGSNLRFCIRIRADVALTAHQCLRVFDAARARLGVRQRVELIETDSVATPAVYGLWRRRLLLPAGLIQRFSNEELRHVFLHELAHLKRRDLEINSIVAFLQVLHWFNPALWFAFHRMRSDRELATDALALSCIGGEETTSYGETILKLLEGLARRPTVPGLVGIAEDKAQLARRLRAIARHGTSKPWKWIAVASMVGIGALALTDAQDRASQRPNALTAAEPGAAPPSDRPDTDNRVGEELRRLELRVVDYDTARPLEGVTAHFELEYYGRGSSKQTRITVKDGIAAVAFVATDLKLLGYRLEKPGYTAPRGEWRKHQTSLIPAEFEVKASQGVEMGGSVVDEAGRPVAGAEVFFDRPINLLLDHPVQSRRWTVPAGESVATTDAAGRWRARALYPDIQWATLRIQHPEFADAVYSTEMTRAMEAEGKDHPVEFEALVQRRAVFTMSPGIPVIGRVLDDAGTRLSGISVRYADRPSEHPYWDELMGKGTVTTDANGEFRIAHLPKKRVYFAAQPEGYAPAVAELDLASSPPEIELRLAKGKKLLGRILDNQDRPVTGARLTLKDWSLWQGVKWEAVSDADGRFHWDQAPVEKFQVQIEKEGFIAQAKILQGGRQELIRLNPVLRLSGRIVDAISQEPVQQFRILWADRDDRFQDLRRFALEGSGGVYSVDVGRLEADLWLGGYAHELLLRIEAKGYLPAISRAFSSRQGDVGEILHDFSLERADAIAGTVLTAAGEPVAGAQVALKTPTSRLRLAGKPRFENLDDAGFPVTDRDGRFRVTGDPEATHLVVVHERGVAWVEAKDLGSEPTVTLQSWGRVEGRVWEYDEPVADEPVWHSSSLLGSDLPGPIEFFTLRGQTDDEGGFSFDCVAPGKHRFYRMIRMAPGSSSGPAEVVEVKPGETASVKLGGVGRPVTGRIEVKNPYVEIEWQKGHYRAHSVHPPRPADVRTPEEFKAWRQREDVQRAFDSIRSHPIDFSQDGSFRIEEMLPGQYQFWIWIHDPRDPDAFARSLYIARFNDSFEVPDTDQRFSREPLDIGVFELSLDPQIEVGKTEAPPFNAVNMEGNEFKLGDFKGKYVLLDFWATWCGPCIAELPYLRDVHKKFGGRDDFVMISLSLDDAVEKPREFAAKNDMPWLQGYLGDWANTDVPQEYGVNGIPALFLIDPEGRMIARGLRGGTVNTELSKWLK